MEKFGGVHGAALGSCPVLVWDDECEVARGSGGGERGLSAARCPAAGREGRPGARAGQASVRPELGFRLAGGENSTFSPFCRSVIRSREGGKNLLVYSRKSVPRAPRAPREGVLLLGNRV